MGEGQVDLHDGPQGVLLNTYYIPPTIYTAYHGPQDVDHEARVADARLAIVAARRGLRVETLW